MHLHRIILTLAIVAITCRFSWASTQCKTAVMDVHMKRCRLGASRHKRDTITDTLNPMKSVDMLKNAETPNIAEDLSSLKAPLPTDNLLPVPQSTPQSLEQVAGSIIAQPIVHLIGQAIQSRVMAAPAEMLQLPGALPGALPAPLPGPLSGALPGPLSGALPGPLSGALPGPLSGALPGPLSGIFPGTISGQLPIAGLFNNPGLSSLIPFNSAQPSLLSPMPYLVRLRSLRPVRGSPLNPSWWYELFFINVPRTIVPVNVVQPKAIVL